MPLGVIVAQVLLNRIIQGLFTQDHHLTQGLPFDGAYKSFAIGIEIWTSRGEEDGFHPACLEQSVKGLGELRVPVVDEVALARQEPLKRMRQLPGALLMKAAIGWGVMPATCTRRVESSMTTST